MSPRHSRPDSEEEQPRYWLPHPHTIVGKRDIDETMDRRMLAARAAHAWRPSVEPTLEEVQSQLSNKRCRVFLPPKARILYKKKRYKILYGGRGSAKSWSVATYVILECLRRKVLVLCARELQKSIEDSVHSLLKKRIETLGLSSYFDITHSRITCENGSEIIFSGLRDNINKIKSMEGLDIVWVEEAESVSHESWEVLIPTVRKEGSEILVVFNPDQDDDPAYVRFVVNRPVSCTRAFMNWRDNPWFTGPLEQERKYLEETDPDAYQHVYEGHCRKITAAQIFRERYVVEAFDPPENAIFLGGADWGFAEDPTAAVRIWITSTPSGAVNVPDIEELWIDREAYGIGVEIDDTPKLFDDAIPRCRSLSILADSARPETISYMRRQGFRISKCEKWEGCVEDGIVHMKGFKKIHIHTRCQHTKDEFKHYSYKIDKKTNKILPIIVDANNHCIDAIRYALSKFVKKRGISREWEKV